MLISGGETTITLKGKGKGGRNTEFLLALAIALDGMPNIYALAGDTDGVDGSEDNAGALIYPDTLARAEKAGLNPKAMLADNDPYTFFKGIGDLLGDRPDPHQRQRPPRHLDREELSSSRARPRRSDTGRSGGIDLQTLRRDLLAAGDAVAVLALVDALDGGLDPARLFVPPRSWPVPWPGPAWRPCATRARPTSGPAQPDGDCPPWSRWQHEAPRAVPRAKREARPDQATALSCADCFAFARGTRSA